MHACIAPYVHRNHRNKMIDRTSSELNPSRAALQWSNFLNGKSKWCRDVLYTRTIDLYASLIPPMGKKKKGRPAFCHSWLAAVAWYARSPISYTHAQDVGFFFFSLLLLGRRAEFDELDRWPSTLNLHTLTSITLFDRMHHLCMYIPLLYRIFIYPSIHYFRSSRGVSGPISRTKKSTPRSNHLDIGCKWVNVYHHSSILTEPGERDVHRGWREFRIASILPSNRNRFSSHVELISVYHENELEPSRVLLFPLPNPSVWGLLDF